MVAEKISGMPSGWTDLTKPSAGVNNPNNNLAFGLKPVRCVYVKEMEEATGKNNGEERKETKELSLLRHIL